MIKGAFPAYLRIPADGKSGPFVMGDGNIYAVVREGSTTADSYLHIYRSTDGGVSWQQRAYVAVGPSYQATIGGFSAVKVDDNTIAVAYSLGVTSYLDWWDVVSNKNIASAFLESNVPATAEVDLAIRSDGSAVVVYHGQQVKNMGSTYDRLFAKVVQNKSATTTAAIALTPVATATDRFPVVTLGTNDLVHINFTSGTTGYHRTISTSNVLNATSASGTLLGVSSKPFASGAVYGTPGNSTGMVLRSLSSSLQAYTFNPATQPTSITAPTLANMTVPTGPVMASVSHVENGENIVNHIFASTADNIVRRIVSSNAAQNGGTTSLESMSEPVTAISVSVTSPSPGKQVLHYLFQTPSGIRYGETVLVEGAPPGLPEAISSSDSVNVSITDTATRTILNDAKSAVDSGAASVADSAHILKIMQATDAGTVSLNESSSFGTVSVQRSDAGSVSISDSGGLPPQSVNASDSGSVSLADSGSLGTIAITANDSGALSIIESRSTMSFVSRADAGAVSATESRATFTPRNTADSGAVSVLESYNIQVVVTASDSGNVSVSDISNVFVDRSGSDVSAIGATETTGGYREIAAADAGAVSAAETSQQHLDRILSDAGTVFAVDDAEVSVFGSMEKTANDTGTVFMVDDRVILVTRTISDSGTVSLADSATIVRTGTFAISAGDSGSASITDTSVVAKTAYKSAADSGSASTTESTSSAVSGLVPKQSFDLSTTSAVDSVNNQTTFDTKNAGDTGNVSVVDSVEKEIFGLVEISAGDAGAVATEESIQEDIALTRPDNSDITVDEFTGNVPTEIAPYNVYVWDGSEWVEGEMFIWNGTAWVEPELRYYDGNTWI